MSKDFGVDRKFDLDSLICSFEALEEQMSDIKSQFDNMHETLRSYTTYLKSEEEKVEENIKSVSVPAMTNKYGRHGLRLQEYHDGIKYTITIFKGGHDQDGGQVWSCVIEFLWPEDGEDEEPEIHVSTGRRTSIQEIIVRLLKDNVYGHNSSLIVNIDFDNVE